jgi:hypothetical protein
MIFLSRLRKYRPSGLKSTFCSSALLTPSSLRQLIYKLEAWGGIKYKRSGIDKDRQTDKKILSPLLTGKDDSRNSPMSREWQSVSESERPGPRVRITDPREVAERTDLPESMESSFLTPSTAGIATQPALHKHGHHADIAKTPFISTPWYSFACSSSKDIANLPVAAESYHEWFTNPSTSATMSTLPLKAASATLLADGVDVEDSKDSIIRSLKRRDGYEGMVAPKSMTCKEPGCGKQFRRPCDLTKHEKTHSRPWKCPIPTCKYNLLGWPTEKEMDRHIMDKHQEAPAMYECHFKPCTYHSKRESNCKQHMEKVHGWVYVRGSTRYP